MRALRVIFGVAFGLGVLIVAAALALPRLVDGESVRETVTQAAQDALGRDLTYATLEFGVLPPSLGVMDAVLSGETAASPPLLEAKEIGLRVSMLPLLWGTVLIDSLVVDGATVRLVRGSDGIELPTAAKADAPPTGEESDSGISLAVRDVTLENSTLMITDRAVSPSVEWRLDELALESSGSLLGGNLDLDGSAKLASGGAVSLDGSVSSDGTLDLTLELFDLTLNPLDPYLEGLSLAGQGSGKIAVTGPAAAPELIAVDLAGSALALRQGNTSIDGGLRLEGAIANPLSAPAGDFDVDATDANVTVGTTLTKAAGIPGRVSGRLEPGPAGAIAVEDLAIVLHQLNATGRMASVSPLAIELRSDAFPVTGWDEVLPALAGGALTGELKLDDFSYDAGSERLGGAIELIDLTRSVEGAAPIVVRGTLRAEGSQIQGDGLTVTSGGESIPVDLTLSDVFGAPNYQVAVATKDAEANRTLTAFLGKPDTLYGPLTLDGTLSGPLDGDVLGNAKGRMGFGIEEGRLVGVSLLKAVFDRFGAAGGAAVDLGRAVGGKDLQRFYGDAFEVLSGEFQVSGGVARTEGLVFRYQGYDVRLRGRIGLADLSLKMAGDLTLREEIDIELAKQLGVENHTPRQRVIPLAAVTGTLDAPKVSLGSGAVARFASAYAVDAYAGEIRRRVEEELGEGTGELVDQGLEVLQGIFGAGRRAPKPAPEPDVETPAPATEDSGSAPAAEVPASPPSPPSPPAETPTP